MTKTLDQFAVPRMLYKLFLSRKTGRLDIKEGPFTHSLWIKEGDPRAGRLEPRTFDPEDIIASMKYATREAMSRELADTGHDRSFCTVGAYGNLLNEQQSKHVCRESLLRIMAQVCTKDIEPEFLPDEIAPCEPCPTSINLFYALFFVFQNYSTPDQLSEIENRHKDKILAPNRNLEYLRPVIQLKQHINDALDKWETPRSISDLRMISGLDGREIISLIALLNMSDTLTISDRTEKPTSTNMTSVQKTTGTQPVKVTPEPKTEKIIVSAKPKTPQKLDDNQKNWIEDLKALLKRAETYNPLTMLGVKTDTRKDELKKAYMKLVARFHPDKLSGTALEAYRKDCEKVFAAIGGSYKMLTDPQKRREFDSILKDPILKGNVLKAEQRQRASFINEKIKVYFRKRDFGKVIEEAQQSLKIFADDPEILSMLAWATFNMEQGGRQAFTKAIYHLEEALRLDRESEKAHFFKAEMLRQLNDNKNALKHYELALKSNPNNKEAQRLVRLLEGRINSNGK